MKKINVIKNTGDKVWFDPSKLKESLLRSGASATDANDVTEVICGTIEEGMTTHKIYRLAYELLKKKSGKTAGRYKLKRAIFEMGPTGYPFERLISALLSNMGFETKSGIIMNGLCIQHEVDVYAKNSKKVIFAECKFHNDQHRKSDVKVSLYVNSRFEDLKKEHIRNNGQGSNYEGWIVTNTRFTSDATQYGNCAGLKLISWDFPKTGNLRHMIDNAGFHPITSLQSLTKKEKAILLEKEIILCRQITDNEKIMVDIGLSSRRISRVIKEAKQIVES